MSRIDYIEFKDVAPEDFIPVLNEGSIREHLISHGIFDSESVREWVQGKIKSSSAKGCCIKAVYVDGFLVGWCGIQEDKLNHEIAIVISKSVWGVGTKIFRDMMIWAKDFDHKEVVIHLLESRPVYKALEKIAVNTHATEMLGRTFVTYHIPVL